MPNRILREGILTSERVDNLSPQAELFYRRLLSAVDDFGRFEGNPLLLIARLYPLRLQDVTPDQIKRWITDCVDAGLLQKYTVSGKDYLVYLHFRNSARAKKSKFPDPPADNAQPARAPAATTDAPKNTGKNTCCAHDSQAHRRLPTSAPVTVTETVVETVTETRSRNRSTKPNAVNNGATKATGHVHANGLRQNTQKHTSGSRGQPVRGPRDKNGEKTAVALWADLGDSEVIRVVDSEDLEAWRAWDESGCRKWGWSDSQQAQLSRAAFWHRAVRKRLKGGKTIRSPAAFLVSRMKDQESQYLEQADLDWASRFLRGGRTTQRPPTTGGTTSFGDVVQQVARAAS